MKTFAEAENKIQNNTAAVVEKIIGKGTKVGTAGVKCGYYFLKNSKVILHTNSDGNSVETLMHTAPNGAQLFDIYKQKIKCSSYFENYSDCENKKLKKTGDDICCDGNGGEQKCEFGSDGKVDFVRKKNGEVIKPTKWHQKIFDQINKKF